MYKLPPRKDDDGCRPGSASMILGVHLFVRHAQMWALALVLGSMGASLPRTVVHNLPGQGCQTRVILELAKRSASKGNILFVTQIVRLSDWVQLCLCAMYIA